MIEKDESDRLAGFSGGAGNSPGGHVDLIGCGPGDPELLTLKAVDRLKQADVVVADRLVPQSIVALARPDARRIDVGKTPYAPSISQHDINQILLREAMQGHRVARLKGGDPGIFGRLAEEVSPLRAAGISVDIIPGVTAAHACAAAIGLPVTLRRAVRHFSVLTGATADGDVDHDWAALARPGQAFAIYMGVSGAGVMVRKMLAAGAEASRSVVIVENGTRPEQRTVHTRLCDAEAAIKDLGIRGPAIIFVGLDWRQANLSRPAAVEVYPPALEDGLHDVSGPQSGDAVSQSRQLPEADPSFTVHDAHGDHDR